MFGLNHVGLNDKINVRFLFKEIHQKSRIYMIFKSRG